MFILFTFLFFITGGLTFQVVLEPVKVAVLRASEVRFNCSTAQLDWVVMIWSLNGRLSLAVSESSGVLNNSTRFSAVDYSSPGEAKWEFIIRNVSRNDSGQVSCQVQNSETVTAGLSVQERGTVELLGPDRAVMEGDQVVFRCVADGWSPAPLISWTLDGKLVDQQLFNSSSVEEDGLVKTNSSLKITAVRNITVACLVSIPALLSPQLRSALLIVEKKSEQRDQTVLIATTVSFSAAALLILIIIAIIYCCKKRKKEKSSYQEEVSRARSQSQTAGDSPAKPGRGQDNLAYVTDPKANDSNSEFTDSGFWQTNNISTIQMPDLVKSNQEANNPAPVRKHRHVTIV